MPAGRPLIVVLDAPEPEAIPRELVDGACRRDGRYRVFDDDDRGDEAKAICVSCPVAQICLAYALRNEQHGVWGGTTQDERRHLRGDRKVVDPWQRQIAADFRVDLGSHMKASQIARKWDMTERTVERNRTRLRDFADAA